MNSITQNVREMLTTNTNRKLSSKEFIYAYWKKYDGLKSTFNLSTFRRLTNSETIARSRRNILAN